MTVDKIISDRQIHEVLHFTTNRGLLGILASQNVKSRARLDVDRSLEHVWYPNCAIRRDPDWVDYVSLTVSKINSRLFGISSTSWHTDETLWWCILSFEPDIMNDEGVVFTTTNNIYTGVQRAEGAPGLEAMFEPSIERWPGNTVVRSSSTPLNNPTCNQAEVLYPSEIGLERMARVYFVSDLHLDIAWAQAETLENGIPNMEVRPDAFD